MLKVSLGNRLKKTPVSLAVNVLFVHNLAAGRDFFICSSVFIYSVTFSTYKFARYAMAFFLICQATHLRL
jgi:hypothetical protein